VVRRGRDRRAGPRQNRPHQCEGAFRSCLRCLAASRILTVRSFRRLAAVAEPPPCWRVMCSHRFAPREN
jgi:hypothetical protein